MTEYTLPYSNTQIAIQIPDTFEVEQLVPEAPLPLPDPDLAIRQALLVPLEKWHKKASLTTSTIGIAINDKTRPIPRPNPLLQLLDHLNALGVNRENISLFIGSGTHKPMTSSELPLLLPQEVIDQYTIIVHDCDQSPIVDLGKTAYQTPIQINADFFHRDVKISVGNIEPHHFMGFSGGVKTAVIGLASRKTIAANHIMLAHPQAKSGIYHINPLRQDIEEIGRKAKIHFSLGTILDEQKNVVKVYFDNPVSVMKSAIPFVRKVFGIGVQKPYDLVIASPGGDPKDINLYQAQKGLTHAARITRDDGWVILLAACPEGSGSQSYENYVINANSHQSILEDFNNGFFEVGPHKAYQIARDANRVNVVLVSSIPPETVKRWLLTPSTPERLNPLINWLVERLPADARIAIMPAATRTIAEVEND